jgi:hypothetical protein
MLLTKLENIRHWLVQREYRYIERNAFEDYASVLGRGANYVANFNRNCIHLQFDSLDRSFECFVVYFFWF